MAKAKYTLGQEVAGEWERHPAYGNYSRKIYKFDGKDLVYHAREYMDGGAM